MMIRDFHTCDTFKGSAISIGHYRHASIRHSTSTTCIETNQMLYAPPSKRWSTWCKRWSRWHNLWKPWRKTRISMRRPLQRREFQVSQETQPGPEPAYCVNETNLAIILFSVNPLVYWQWFVFGTYFELSQETDWQMNENGPMCWHCLTESKLAKETDTDDTVARPTRPCVKIVMPQNMCEL